ncbi:LuxR C-terminal-related transcriptional regulator [Streptomyces ipomoeae]|uniref:Transcriptional regulator, LuxR family n=1 Tax=Streptomyces ipomoeae 91-03 TaxID=698759 RepID=L1KX70_9ACTN|nr:LuxR C-terminal-related transcriptional regulator [Streptomyces ipomoeae]EKX65416.1 transcriptional regulator, LuxR family [Streptomyces ipomoeae 91-03]MDX2694433.1 LuxR C-terminal-related transcriptional regulator [Streptomyces ipomoeae]MDX2837919.1 LuxR C-terminal-related transcriptional regulator [Streptomyces ipomoeae]
MSARPTRPPATHLDLTPAQLRIAQKVAEGQSTEAIATDLTITAGTINVQMKHCGQKLGVSGRAAVVHACYVTGQLERPQKAAFPEALSDTETETWRMIATGAISRQYAERARISHDEAQQRMKALRQRLRAHNDPHLVTLGWTYDVLDASLVEMASGTLLRAQVPV